VTCYWTLLSALPPYLLLFPNAVVCINIGLGSNATGADPRQLGNGGLRIDYNLYRNATYTSAAIAGGPAVVGATTPITVAAGAPFLGLIGNGTVNFTVYGKVPASASLRAALTVGNADTVYSASFAGAVTMNYSFYNLIAPACTASGLTSTTAFNVTATVVNNCTISAAPMAFGPSGVINTDQRATGSVTVQCVNNNAYQIGLNGGSVASSVTARRMKNTVTTETIGYQLSATLDGPSWGDGTNGTTFVTGTGSGGAVSIPLYGRVPAQGTPSPGDYKDTVTATIYF
jgi:spore coat protein U-like protein